MKRDEQLQQLLAEKGVAALEDAKVRQRVEEDAEAHELLEALLQLDAALDELPAHDAPDTAVTAVLARVEQQEADSDAASAGEVAEPDGADASRSPSWWRRWRQTGTGRGSRYQRQWLLAAMLLATVSVVLLPRLLNGPLGMAPETSVGDFAEPAVVAKAAEQVNPDRAAEAKAPADQLPAMEPSTSESLMADEETELRALGYVGDAPTPGEPASEIRLEVAERRTTPPPPSAPRKPSPSPPPPPPPPPPSPPPSPPRVSTPPPEDAEYIEFDVPPANPGRRESKSEPAPLWVGSEADITFRGGSPRIEDKAKSELGRDEEARERLRERLAKLDRGLQRSDGAVDQDADADSIAELEEENQVMESDQRVQRVAQVFLEELQRVDGLKFRSADGYWANTYRPGDPRMRFLHSRLSASSSPDVQWHRLAKRVGQFLDPPQGAALGVYLHSDQSAVEGPSRLRLQVGIQGSPRSAGRRTTMNLAVVLDLRHELSAADASAVRAVLLALAEARDLGDRFRLVVAGRAGGQMLEPEAFRHGPIGVLVEDLLQSPAESSESGLSLPAAMRLAVSQVAADDDPNAPLGSSAVLLLTPGSLGNELASELSALAHRSTVAGIPVSTVKLGRAASSAASADAVEAIALAGGGQARLLAGGEGAVALVEAELSAASRAVARAIRLRIRLAPGVELVDVLGSRRLDEVATERTREAEQSMDLQLARRMGIAADRGDDEDGIQILVPSFYAGDSHVILLDVVVPGPGPVAEVTARYKDLVHPGNRVAQAQLTLPRGERGMGSLQLKVLENVLAVELSQGLERAAEALEAGDRDAAIEELERLSQLLSGLSLEIPELARSSSLLQDQEMIDGYASWLRSDAASSKVGTWQGVRSLRYASLLKISPPLASVESLSSGYQRP